MSTIAAEKIGYLQVRIARFDDQHAYKELFASLYPSLYHFAFGLLKSKETAEEVVSDAFIRIWEKRKGLEKISNLRVYLYVATRNIAFNYLDKQKRTATNSLEDCSSELASCYFDPEQLMITADMLAMIEGEIDRLPPKCKMIFTLVKEDKLKYREVATIMNISVKTVENQLAIAIRKIAATIRFDIGKSVSTPTGQSHSR